MNLNAVRRLAALLDEKESDVLFAIKHGDSYRAIRQKKKDGSIRQIYEPHPDLKFIQKRILRRFLEKIPISSDIFHGFLSNEGIVTNAMTHCIEESNLVVSLDLKDAFPTVTEKFIRETLGKIMEDEIKSYLSAPEGKSYPSFLPKRKSMTREDKKTPILQLGEEFLDLIIPLLVYKGRLPQGAPTSPYLLNVLIEYSGLAWKIFKFLEVNELTDYGDVKLSIYADDITFSTVKGFSNETLRNLVSLIEAESPWKINRKKVQIYNRQKISPLVTGLRVVRLPVERFFCCETHGKEHMHKKACGVRRKKLGRKIRKNLPAYKTVAYIPRKLQRKIRGLFHRAIYDETLDKKVEGYFYFLHDICARQRVNLPNQIYRAYQKWFTARHPRT